MKKQKKMKNSYSSVPSSLMVPGDTDLVGQPGPVTREQLLPLEKLSFENLQRLSVRLLSAEKSVVHCQEFGVHGQAQDGIDLYARITGVEKMEAWQCKRYQVFQPSDISNAIDLFLKGDFCDKSSKFVIVTSADTEERNLSLAEQEGARLLKEKDIDFVLLGRSQLTVLLKDYPKIIDDFFGLPWVRSCCGDFAANELSGRLTASQVSKYRKALRGLYSAVFEETDSFVSKNIDVQNESDISLTLSQRWVRPTLSEKVEYLVDERTLNCDGIEDKSIKEEQKDKHRKSNERHENESQIQSKKIDVDSFFGTTDRAVVLGIPGQGKSSLLRMLAIDLLSEEPKLENVATRHGQRLPLWIPFAFLTRGISNGLSLVDVAKEWLRLNSGNDELVKLAGIAINDDRLLLLIDGVDEWSDPKLAIASLATIQGFLSQGSAACFLTSRPVGYQRLGRMSGSWRHVTIEPLSEGQQIELVSKIVSPIDPTNLSKIKAIEIERFSDAIRREEALTEMARTPLLLLGLVSLWLRNRSLPTSKINACGDLVDVMLERHPNRRNASSISQARESLAIDVRREAISRLAFTIHSSLDGTMIPRKEALECFSAHFQDCEGMDKASARNHAREMLPYSDQVVGIISEVSSDCEVQFVHRVFQEFLTAEYLFTLAIEEQEIACRSHCGDSSWHQVFLFLLLKTKRSHDVERLIVALEESELDLSGTQYRKLLIAEAIMFNARLSPELRLARVEGILYEIECSGWMPLREAYLEIVLSVLPSTGVYALVIKRLKQWAPVTEGLEYGRIVDGLKCWPQDSRVEEALWRYMNHEYSGTKLSAARGLAVRCGGNEVWKNRIILRLSAPIDSETVSAFLIALAEGWSDDDQIISIFEDHVGSTVPEISLSSIYGLVLAKKQDDFCRSQFLKNSSQVIYSEVIVSCALTGWPGDQCIKEAALDSIKNEYGLSSFDRKSLWQILCRGYSGDDLIAEAIATEISEDKLYEISYDVDRKSLFDSFAGHPKVSKSAQKLLFDSDATDLYKYSLVAGLAKTTSSKKWLMEQATTKNRMNFHAFDALIQVWGNDDEDTLVILEKKLKECEIDHTFAIYFAKYSTNKEDCRRILIETLANNNVHGRPGLLIEGLALLGRRDDDDQIVDLANSWIEKENYSIWESETFRSLVRFFSDHSKVKEIVFSTTGSDGCDWSLLAAIYKEDSTVRDSVINQTRLLSQKLRLIIARRSRQRASYDLDFKKVAESCRFDHSANIRVIGAISSAEIALSQGGSIDDLKSEFSREAVVCGPNYEARREAGIAGLITLDELSCLPELNDRNGNKASISFRYDYSGEDLLMHYIIKKWEDVSIALGDKLSESFKDEHALRKLMGLAERNAAFSVLESLEENLPDSFPTKSLGLSTRAKQDIGGWIEECFFDLGFGKEPGDSVTTDQANRAGHLLASYAQDELNVPIRLEDFIREKHAWARFAMETLAKGWPDSEVIEEIWSKSDYGASQILDLPVWLISCKGSPEQLTLWVRHWIAKQASTFMHLDLREDRWFIMRRCFEDASVSEALMVLLEHRPTEHERVSLPWLIRGGTLKDSEKRLSNWAEKTWKYCDDHLLSPFGFHIMKGQSIGLRNTLLEILMTEYRYHLRE